MEWKTHGERQIYTNKWVNLCLVDVQQPDGRRWEYHVVRLRHLAVAAVVNDRQEVLMMWRHRFVTDSWAWELPMGLVEEGESPEEAAARERAPMAPPARTHRAHHPLTGRGRHPGR